MSLVPYAGAENPTRGLFNRKAAAYRMFKGGSDTLDIARFMQEPEAVVYGWINDILTANYQARVEARAVQ